MADDQEVVRAGLCRILDGEEDLEVVAEAGDGEEAVRRAGATRPDVVLMDIRMPVMDGLAAARRLLAEDSSVKVVILTTFDLDEYVYEAIKIGASGFVLKDAPADEIVRAVRAAAAGDALVSPSVTRRLLAEFAKVRTRDNPSVATLTERELDVLRQLAMGLSNSEIGVRLFISEGTVRTHVTHLLSKLDARDRVQAVVLAYETGLVSPGHTEDR
ncbi:response regulator transcription factor [Nocardioides bizhenqiangii]|uniref:Response regulator transcription factor n=1 Tax=Nocardioides bizhenqiangii TaxID=3095076 RepID=A0ABZ0ZVW3_9ACTN|nr:response regulator transcription factor [Nocardioides sp. HM61]WQQ28466.1 response regulator transcription factor [Nocardioides sp. HM61]